LPWQPAGSLRPGGPAGPPCLGNLRVACGPEDPQTTPRGPPVLFALTNFVRLRFSRLCLDEPGSSTVRSSSTKTNSLRLVRLRSTRTLRRPLGPRRTPVRLRCGAPAFFFHWKFVQACLPIHSKVALRPQFATLSFPKFFLFNDSAERKKLGCREQGRTTGGRKRTNDAAG
jgi:hypothetical protein